MKKLRILIDDAGQCRTQRAVLAALVRTLPAAAEVIRSSGLPAPAGWNDAPPESARRLAARLEALAPLADTVTLFLPGHLVPGDSHAFAADGAGAPLPAFTSACDLDIFVADNGSPLALHLAQTRMLHPDYQTCSSYPVAGFTSHPSWLAGSGLTSAQLVTQRPWYVAHVPSRTAWLRWVAKALEQGLLAVEDVECDVREGAARPSLLEDVHALSTGAEAVAGPDTTLDTLFVFPEVRLTDARFAMLHSRALQERTLLWARMEAARKLHDVPRALPFWARVRRGARGGARKALKRAYHYYSVTLRPILRGSSAGR